MIAIWLSLKEKEKNNCILYSLQILTKTNKFIAIYVIVAKHNKRRLSYDEFNKKCFILLNIIKFSTEVTTLTCLYLRRYLLLSNKD